MACLVSSWPVTPIPKELCDPALETSQHEYSAGTIAATFNKHFKTFGAIQGANVLRDLGKEKGKTSWVNSDTTKDPQTWYLLEEGKKGMAALIQESKAPAA